MPTRLSSCLAALALLLVAASPALAQQSPREQADALNDQGKQYFAEKRYEDAYGAFRQAATLSPEARFFFNMCYALNFLERYQDAIQACEQVEAADGADAALKEKTQRALASLREKLAAQQAAGGGTTTTDPDAGGGAAATDPNAGGGTPTDPNAGGGAAAGGAGDGAAGAAGPDPFIATEAAGPVDSYKWSVGGELGVLGNINAGKDAFDNSLYGPSGVNLRLFANFVIHEPSRVGVQAYLGIGSLPADEDNNPDEALGMADLGGALFTHRPLFGHVYWTPLAGLSLAIRQPQELTQGFISLGGRAEVGFSYVFGPAGEHAVNVTPGFTVYFPSSGEQETDFGDPRDASYYGFDETTSLFALNVGYTYRFSTPFGSTPLITLE